MIIEVILELPPGHLPSTFTQPLAELTASNPTDRTLFLPQLQQLSASLN